MEIKNSLWFLILIDAMYISASAYRRESDPELTAGFMQGDMIFDSMARNGWRGDAFQWPNQTVYYKFFNQFSDAHRNQILHAMHVIQSVSCIRFKELITPDHATFVNITNFKRSCFSRVGWRREGAQELNLQTSPIGEGCYRLGTIVHELLHTLGFFHMQSSSNRDDYVRIVWRNIKMKNYVNFLKLPQSIVDNFDQEYDYSSILHYSPYAFSTNGRKTIVPLRTYKYGNEVIGQRSHLSSGDIQRLNIMYRCPIKIRTSDEVHNFVQLL
uniref:Metalloendopeptidase n=1 Tax=Glossina morsitans morsitans TaxID=37546 RepID=A0A1B0FLV9_GLOMM